MNDTFRPIHPSEILVEEFLQPNNITIEQLAKDISLSIEEVNNFLINKVNFTNDFNSRLGICFKMGDKFFNNLQKHYELDILHLSKSFEETNIDNL